MNIDSALQRIILLTGAVVSLSLAAALFIVIGLPERAAFTGWTLSDGQTVAPEVGALAPPFERRTLDGGAIDLTDLRGAPVVMNFWATWCVPCIVEMPELQAVYEEYHDDGLRLLGINLGEPRPVVQEWVTSLGLTFDILLDDGQEVAALYRLRAQPSTVVVSPEGGITHIFHGPLTASQLREALAAYFP